ncbi:MAG: O-antigen ligase family protein [Candidatus Poribacteria bacterium]
MTVELFSKKISDTISKIQSSRQVKQFIGLATLLGFEVILGAALAKFTDSPILLVLLFGALTIAALVNIEYTFYVLIFCLPFSYRYIMPPRTEMRIPTEPLLAILLCAFFIQKIFRLQQLSRSTSRDEPPRFPFWLPIFGYLFSLFISMINSPYLYYAAKGSIRVTAYVMTAVLVFEIINSRQRFMRLFTVSIIPSTIAVGWTAIFLAARLSLWRWSSAYEGLLFEHYSIYGAFTAAIFLILLSRTFFDSGNFDRVGWTMLLGFYTIALLLCFSRGAWIAVIAGVFFLLFVRTGEGQQHRKVALITAVGLLLLILISIPGVAGEIYNRIATIFDVHYASNRSRLLRWGTALMMFLRHPIVGWGYTSFALSYKNDPALVGSYVARYKPGAHSEFLTVLAEQGIIGFISWMWLIIAFFRYGFRLLKRIDIPFWQSIIIGLMAAELSFLVNFITNNLLQADRIGIPFWLIYGLLPAIENIVNAENNRGRNNE